MSAADEGTGICGKWMPKAKAYCGRGAGHPVGFCKSVEAMERTRQRNRAAPRAVTPKHRARWHKAHKFVRLGITEEAFNAMLVAQNHACGMCLRAFTDDERIFVDHDHACCPPPPDRHGQRKTCGRCVRGLLCFRCNTALGYIERYAERASAYLSRPALAASLWTVEDSNL